MAVAGKSDIEEPVVEPVDLCPKCGTKMLLEDGEYVCPHCDGDIDYFGDDEDES